MHYSLNQLEHFYTISCYKSFVKAAKQLGISKAQISQSIAKLERTFGHKLFHRTTRSVSLTSAGESLLPLTTLIMKTKDEIDEEVNLLHKRPAGSLRVTCPNAFAECYLSAPLAHFLKIYPLINVELLLSSQLINLEKEKIDVAIRLTHEPPKNRVAKQLGFYQIGYFAAPSYLKAKGTPQKIDEIKYHHCLVSRTVLSARRWLFNVKGNHYEITVKPRLEADNHQIIKKAVLDGLGITCLPWFLVESEVAKGALTPLFVSFQKPPTPVYVIFSHTRKISLKLSIFLQFLSSVMVKEEK